MSSDDLVRPTSGVWPRQSVHPPDTGGVEVHAGAMIEADDVRGREHLIRHAARPGVCLDRLSLDEEGRVQIRFKRPWKNGTTGVTTFLVISASEREVGAHPRCKGGSRSEV
jgi:hypothetical protein